MRVFLTLVVVALVAAAAGVTIIYTGPFNVAATDAHWPPVRWALDTTFKNSVERRAADLDPPPLDDPALVSDGAEHYASGCAICHGRPGGPRPEMAKHMRPEPPDLTVAALPWSASEIFWIVKHGVKMTGMPAWGPMHDDDALWAIVAFVQKLPQMEGEQYNRLLRTTEAATAAAQGQPAQDQTAAAQRDEAKRDRPESDQEAQEPQTAQQDARQRSTEEQQTAEDATPAATVEMTSDLKFVPRSVTIQVGDTVRWVNVSKVPHTVTADPEKASDAAHVVLPKDAETFGSGFIQADGSYSRRFTVAGRYKYFCIPHEMAGMIGELVVEE